MAKQTSDPKKSPGKTDKPNSGGKVGAGKGNDKKADTKTGSGTKKSGKK